MIEDLKRQLEEEYESSNIDVRLAELRRFHKSKVIEAHVVDDEFHCENGPAIVFQDGVTQYYWHGQLVPDDWIAKPDALDPVIAITWQNERQRKAFIDIWQWKHGTLTGEVIECPIRGLGVILQVTDHSCPKVMVRWANGSDEPMSGTNLNVKHVPRKEAAIRLMEELMPIVRPCQSCGGLKEIKRVFDADQLKKRAIVAVDGELPSYFCADCRSTGANIV